MSTIYDVKNERLEVFYTGKSLKEAKKIAKAKAIETKEWMWVLDWGNDDYEMAIYNEKGEEV